MTWPEAFALVFGVVPLTVVLLAAAAAYPGAVLPLCLGAALVYAGDRIGRRRAAVAKRAAVEYRRNAAIVAAPLPDMPTVPLHAVPTRRARVFR